MSPVSFKERTKLPDSPDTVSEHRDSQERKARQERCSLWSRGSRIWAHSCSLPSHLNFFYSGKKRTFSVSDFKFYGIKIPFFLGVLFLLLSSLSDIFLLPALLIGLVLNWSTQTYLNASAINLDPHHQIHNKETFH